MKQFGFLVLVFLLLACSKESGPEQLAMECEVINPQFDTAVLLVMGQSNAANAGEQLYSSTCLNTSNYYRGEFYDLKDPLKGANGAGGSVWSRLADQLLAFNFAEHIIIAPVAVGGSSIEQWVPGGDLHPLIAEQLNALHADGLSITQVLWHQGESNNSALNSNIDPVQNALSYSQHFENLVSYLRTIQVDAPIYIAVATRCGSWGIDYDLQDAQVALANDSLGILNGPNTDILGNEYRYDDCHFNAEGLKVHAFLWANILLQE